MKFDLCITNPPYNNNLDLKIIKSILPLTKELICIHPAGWLYDKKFGTKLYNDLRDSKHIKEVELFWGNSLFNIKNQTPLCITVWDTEKKFETCNVNDIANGETYTAAINNISWFGSNFNKIENIINKAKTISNETLESKRAVGVKSEGIKLLFKKQTEYGIAISGIRGNSSDNDYIKDAFFTFSTKKKECDFNNQDVITNPGGGETVVWWFNSEIERENFRTYCNSKIFRIIYAFYKNNLSISGGDVFRSHPWLDFNQRYNDKTLCNLFQIDYDTWKYIDNFIPKYYPDYISGFENMNEEEIKEYFNEIRFMYYKSAL